MLKKLLLTIFLTAPVLVYSQKHYTIAELEEKLNTPTEATIKYIISQGFVQKLDSGLSKYLEFITYFNGNDRSKGMQIAYSPENSLQTFFIGYWSDSKQDFKTWMKEIKANQELEHYHTVIGSAIYRHKIKPHTYQLNKWKYNGQGYFSMYVYKNLREDDYIE